MAVYTCVDKSQLLSMLDQFTIGNLVDFHGISAGTENSNYLIVTDKGKYILTLYERRVERKDLPFFIEIMRYLGQNQIDCPLPVPDNDGNILFEIAERPAALFTFINGRQQENITDDICFQVGRQLALLHNLTTKFKLRRDNDLSINSWRRLFDQYRGGITANFGGVDDKIAAAITDVERDWPDSLPQGIIHADLFPDNVFFINNEISGVIDFYFSCYDFFAYDLAICVNGWCFTDANQFDRELFKALLAGYDGSRSLTSFELAALPVLVKGSTVRFLLTRLIDWIEFDDLPPQAKRDPQVYLARLDVDYKKIIDIV